MSRDWPSLQYGCVPKRAITRRTEAPADKQEVTAEAEIVNLRFTKSDITSKAAFTYEEAQHSVI